MNQEEQVPHEISLLHELRVPLEQKEKKVSANIIDYKSYLTKLGHR